MRPGLDLALPSPSGITTLDALVHGSEYSELLAEVHGSAGLESSAVEDISVRASDSSGLGVDQSSVPPY